MTVIQKYIFNRKLLQKTLERVDIAHIESIEHKKKVLLNWKHAIESSTLKNAGEVAIHGDFLIDIFSHVLGYKRQIEHPTEWNLAHEQKTKTDATKADGALGFFTSKEQDIRAVIELKDIRTNLDAKQHRKHDKRSPVEQAFSYVHKSGKLCRWVIVSNYEEIRLYHADSSGEYEHFSVPSLTHDTEFLRFYTLLSADNLLSKDQQSPLDALYVSNEAEQENISKTFYTHYKQARIDLFEHIKQQNPDQDELMLLEKTQKLLDRFIFVCFCEDTGLLPQNIFRQVVQHAKQSFSMTEHKIWPELQGLFHAIDIGNAARGINAFDGGLFAPDTLLNALNIGDNIFEELARITDYDFDSDLSVNILGHIFEQSISDLEELRANIQGQEADLKRGKRKKDGIFYTPEYVTQDIVEKTLGGWLERCKESLGRAQLPELTPDDYASIKIVKSTYRGNKRVEQHRAFWEAYKEILMKVKVLDPACGSGAFLNQAFKFLYEEGQAVNTALADLSHGQKGMFDLDRHILSNNLYGVDLNNESVEITKLSLWLLTAKKDSQLTALDENVKCGNSLIDNPLIAGDKTFKWETEFPKIVRNGGFDVIIGNPPYGATIGKDARVFLLSKYQGISRTFSDSYILFMLLGLESLLNEGGNLGYIIPNTWLYVASGEEYRKMLLKNFQIATVVQYKEKVFEDATVDCVSVVITNSKDPQYSIRVSTVDHCELLSENVTTPQILESQEYFNFNISPQQYALLNKIKSQSVLIGEHFEIKNGIKPYEVGKGNPPQTREIVKMKPYTSDVKTDDSFVPLIGGSLFHRYALYWDKNYWISYGEWLAAPRDSKIFHAKEKLIFRQTSDSIIGTFITDPFIMRNNTHILLLKDERFTLKYTLTLLNSALMDFVYWSLNPEKGEALAEVKAFHLAKLLCKDIPLEQQAPFVEKADSMLDMNMQLQVKRNKFLRFIDQSYTPKSLSNRLKNFELLSFGDFTKELKRQKVVLTKKDEFELIELFEEQKTDILNIKQVVEDTDKAIDRMVYELYNLTEEEIKIIEPQ